MGMRVRGRYQLHRTLYIVIQRRPKCVDLPVRLAERRWDVRHQHYRPSAVTSIRNASLVDLMPAGPAGAHSSQHNEPYLDSHFISPHCDHHSDRPLALSTWTNDYYYFQGILAFSEHLQNFKSRFFSSRLPRARSPIDNNNNYRLHSKKIIVSIGTDTLATEWGCNDNCHAVALLDHVTVSQRAVPR